MEAFFIISLVTYFLPTLIAGFRNHNNLNSIVVINLFLGWTILGWIVALVWSVANSPVQPSNSAPIPPTESPTSEDGTPLPTIDMNLVDPAPQAPKQQRQVTNLSWVEQAKAELAEERKRPTN